MTISVAVIQKSKNNNLSISVSYLALQKITVGIIFLGFVWNQKGPRARTLYSAIMLPPRWGEILSSLKNREEVEGLK